MKKYLLSGDLSCNIDTYGYTVSRMPMEFNPREWGIALANGKTLELEIDESIKSVFAMTTGGLLSNEILLDSQFTYYEILVTTKGGLKIPSYPVLRLN